MLYNLLLTAPDFAQLARQGKPAARFPLHPFRLTITVFFNIINRLRKISAASTVRRRPIWCETIESCQTDKNWV